MNLVWQIVTVLSSILTVVGTLIMVFTYRRERVLSVSALGLNVALSVVMVTTFGVLAGPGLKPLVAGAAVLVGLGIGLLRGLFTRLAVRDGQVVGRHSPLFLLGWGLSFAMAGVLNLLDSVLAAAAGMLALYLSTGTQVALNSWLLIRCLMLHPTGGAPAASTEKPPGLPERGEIPRQTRNDGSGGAQPAFCARRGSATRGLTGG